MDDTIHYESMNYYVAQIRQATTPLGILLNADYLTDLIDVELNKMEVSKKYGIKTQMERSKLRETLNRNNNCVQMHRLWNVLRAENSNIKNERYQ